MNSLAIAMVKNEADIVEAFVRHNLAFVDLMVVIDNGSTDGTRDILTALQREGEPVLVFDDPIFGYYQSEKVSHVYRKVVPVFQPEVVWLLDADEFIHAPSREWLEAQMAQVKPGEGVLLPWRTQLPQAVVDTDRLLADPLGAMPERRRREEPAYTKLVLRRDPSDDEGLVIEQGSHGAHRADGGAVQARLLDGAALVHLPVRSVDQLAAKVINGWQAYLVKNRHGAAPTAGFQWQQLYERIVHGGGLDAAALTQVALDYAQRTREGRQRGTDVVHDPVPTRYGALRHGGLARTGLLAKVALNMEAFILYGDGSEPPAAQPSIVPRRDLCGLLEVLRQCGATRLLGARGTDGPLWARELARANPAWQDAAVTGAPQVLLVPATPAIDFASLADDATQHPAARVVWWPAAAETPAALEAALLAWYAAGWEPHMMQTMGYRALSSFAELRSGAVVLHPVEPARAERARAVRSLLCQPAPQAAISAARQVLHPMQDMPLPLAA